MHSLESVSENEKHKLLWDLRYKPNLGQTTKPSNSQQKKKKRELAE